MKPESSSSTKTINRPAGDFLDQTAAEKAGIIEARLGPSAPLQYGPSFEWPASPAICSLEYDSRNVKPNSLYFALPGLHADGHDFVSDAIKRGASVIVHQRELAEYQEGILYILVKDSRFAMSPIADSFYDHPSRLMKVIGVTGTEGKSTTVYLIYQLLKLLGKKAGFISTVMHGDGLTEKWNSEHQTTPEAVTIHRLLTEMRGNGAEYAVLESSSHGLSKKTNRLGDVEFDAGVMTNVTHEHLEFHGTWEQYRSDKAELFRKLKNFGVINADDPSADYFAKVMEESFTTEDTEFHGEKDEFCAKTPCSANRRFDVYSVVNSYIFTFSTKGADADLSVRRIESGADGNSYEVFCKAAGETFSIKDKLPGAFNAGNVLAALLAVSNLLSLDIKQLLPLTPRLKPVRGRMTAVNAGQPFELLVDYAHTPSSFMTILPPLKERINSTGARLICLFGSAGERDTQKRRTQGEIAARYSDIVILADEDPRGEEPMAILEEIVKGCETEKRMIRSETLFLIPNRPLAIRKAVSLARRGDLVLLLGKGHENSIIYADGAVAYDEIGEAEAALSEALASQPRQ